MKNIPEIVFATNNSHKLEEARAILEGKVKVMSLAEIGCHDDIPETADTLEGNALIKARWVKERYGYDCFADDTGLMVEALGGAPGVYSARYAGEHCSPADNIKLLLKNLSGKTDRRARFATVVALILGNEEYLFEGEVKGMIAEENSGTAGFGYDPVFVPENSTLSFAEMAPEDKNAISHRGRAMAKLSEFLSINNQ
ncbi:MAG: non-canonical purine NTP diphosphatase [Muribaculaceae bacterium]|nr:non-canonical purine NTP diphosphatase [Muribaculaceae bacterium]